MYIIKSNGDRTAPCDSPINLHLCLGPMKPFTFNWTDLLVKNEWIDSRNLPPAPFLWSLMMRHGIGTLSKAFSKSISKMKAVILRRLRP